MDGAPPPVSLRRLAAELRPYRRDILAGFLLMGAATPLSLVHPLIWMAVVDHAVVGRQIEWLAPALAAMLAIHGIALVLGSLQERRFERVGQHFVRDLRDRAYAKLSRQTASYFHEHRTGELATLVVSDIDAMQSSIVAGIVGMLNELLTFAGVLACVTWINWKIGLLVLLPLGVAFTIVRIFNDRVRAIYRQARERLGEVGARLQENLSGALVIQGFNQVERENERFQAATARYCEKSMEAVRLRTVIFPTVYFTGFLSNALMLGLGAWFVYLGEFSLGGLVALRGYWWQLNSPIRTLAQVNDLIQRALAASRRVYEVLDAPIELPEPSLPAPVPAGPQPVTFRHLTFQYPGTAAPVLRDIHFTIEPGECVAIAGSSGAGKSTLLNLLMRFYDPSAGSVLYGGVALSAMSAAAWRSRLALVSQETFLFQGSIRDNLRLGKRDADEPALWLALARAHADAFVQRLDQGLDTVIGERGVKLSGGQRQRIGIARAFLADPALLLLDEPTSSVEAESENLIVESIEELMAGRTVVVTSHRPTLLRRATRVLLLHQERIAESGSHQELLTRGGLYARMYARWEEAVAEDAVGGR